jgi:predicted HicB family RNase H-like nuclease
MLPVLSLSLNRSMFAMARKPTKRQTDVNTTAEKLRPVRLEIPEDLHARLRFEAARRDASLGETIRQLLEEHLPGKPSGSK